ncbi:MAG: NFACT RNA binding domain-containing protein [Candidatus Faecousia sp.]|nr:NFACT RNA binding domain-containing protein [Bacillota bacterium]MDY4219073.1 NFACT RNA binding domain-containing protein [Candidatus Faecousia sp.]
MAFDAFFLSGVLEELRKTALGARVEKIHQPARDTVILLLRCQEGRQRLLIAANPTAPRLHLTGANPENPEQPPMFCMLLRKHLSGGKLTAVEQPPMERLVRLTFQCTDELGDSVNRYLVAELMGRTTNIYLLGADGRILDCLRRVGLDDSAKRQALPGLYYQPPEPVEKRNPAEMGREDFLAMLRAPGPDLLADRLMDALGGLSPLVCREASLYALGDVDARLEGADLVPAAERLVSFFDPARRGPHLYEAADGTPKAYACVPIRQYGRPSREAESYGALLDRYYTLRDRRDVMRQKAQAIRKTVQNLRDRTRRKMALQEKERLTAQDREHLRQMGDIVTANLHAITKGQRILEAENFYDPDMKQIQIPLSPLLSPQQNAAKFYKEYAKAKNAEKELTRQLELGRGELEYLESVLEELDRAENEQELEEIRQELAAGGYVRQDPGRKRMKQAASKPMRFVSTDGYPIYVGRNNRQNDELTTKLAQKNDLWLHVQKQSGSHVIIPWAGVQPPDDTITQAAQLAAWFSQGRQGQNVAVDVTPVRYVKKPGGAKPGMVVYTTYRTVYVTPDPGLAEKLKTK